MAFSSRETQLLELKDMLSQLNKTISQQAETIASLQKLLEETQALAARRQEQIEYLTRKLYGPSSEKQPKQADGQLTIFDMFSQLFDEAEYDHDPEVQEEETVVIKEHTRKTKRSNKEKFKDLKVDEVVVDLPEEEQDCSVCGTPMEKIGKEYVREELVYIPAVLKLVKYYRATYKCPACTDGFTPDVDHHFVKSEVPAALIPHGFASESLVSWCMYQKYVLAVPLYRQEQNWLQFNVELSRTTMANWIIYCAEHCLVHIYDYFHRELLKREFLMADETRVQVLKEPDRRAQTQSFMWLVRSGEDGLPVIILFGYTETRARYNIEKFLEGYPGGYLETDGYQGYNNLKNIKRCGCWSHLRRGFFDAIPKGKKSDSNTESGDILMKKVMLVFGTRPEAIKMCPLVNELKKRAGIQTIVCVTAQHRQMLDQVLATFNVVPDYDLNIMKDRQSLFDITTNILMNIKTVLEEAEPDVVLVHGDTSTTFVTALACFYLRIPVGHVEAGLRTYNIYSPYPEEFNREAVSIVSQYNFAPTPLSRENLLREGRKKESIFVTGNTVIDAMQHTVKEDYTHPELDWVGSDKLIFITAHRRENLGEPMHHMFRAIRRVLDEHPNCKAIYPIHMNPVVREAAEAELGNCDQIHIIEPIEVFDCHNFEARSFLCLTDSGGIQEECPSYGVPVLVMRDTTERPEGVDAGTLKLVGTDEETIYSTFKMLLENKTEYEKMSRACNPYGDGHACERIADILEGKEYQPWMAK